MSSTSRLTPRRPPKLYEIRIVNNDFVIKVTDHLRRIFFRGEPLNRCVKLLEGRVTCLEWERFCLKQIWNNLSLMAVSEAGEVIGLCLNVVITKDEPEEEIIIQDKRCEKILELLDHVDKQVDIFGRYPNIDDLLEVFILSVDPIWRGQGVATKLVRQSRDLALQNDFNFMRGICTGYTSARVMKKVGFECIYKLNYKDYKEDGVPVFTPELPHNEISVWIEKLS